MTAGSGRLASLEALRRAGRLDDAVARARAWTRASPRDPAAWAALADILASASRPDLASAAWDQALALDPLAMAALCGKARALQAMGRPGEASQWFERALAVDDKTFDARFGLALVAFDAGDLDRADALIIGLEAGGQPGPTWLAARIAAARGEFGRARPLIETLLSHPHLSELQRAEALLLRSLVLDGLADFDAAFAAASEGKAIQRRLFAARSASREGETRKLQRLAAWFAAADPAPWASAPDLPPGADDPARHVFLLGFPRSGTTLLEQALAGHPDVVTLEEAPTLANSYQAFLSSAQGLEALARITPAEAATWRTRYWRVAREHGAAPAGKTFLDKAPAGTLNLPVIAKLFPRAKILFAVRDPRDVVLSCFFSAFQMNTVTYAFTDLAETAACYSAAMTMARVYRGLLPLDLHEVRHEMLVDDFAGGLRAISGFLGLTFDPAMTDVAATAARRPVRTPSAAQVRAGLNRRGLARWRAYEARMTPIFETLRPWIDHFAYSAD